MKPPIPKVALVPVPFDDNASWLKGPAKAPDKIAEVFLHGSLNMTSELGVAFTREETLYLAQALNCQTYDDIKASAQATLAALKKAQSVPIFIGGDHSVTYPLVDALTDGYQDLTILHFDAHPDLYHEFKGNPHANACPFARIMEQKRVKRLVQVGIRTMNQHQQAQADKFGVEVYAMKDRGQLANLQLDGPLYISFDIDALDPSCAPGVSHVEPGGLSVREVLDVLHAIQCPIVGADIVEYNPNRDINDLTAYACVKLIKEIAGLMQQNGVSPQQQA